jgi:hypothetical protein
VTLSQKLAQILRLEQLDSKNKALSRLHSLDVVRAYA